MCSCEVPWLLWDSVCGREICSLLTGVNGWNGVIRCRDTCGAEPVSDVLQLLQRPSPLSLSLRDQARPVTLWAAVGHRELSITSQAFPYQIEEGVPLGHGCVPVSPLLRRGADTGRTKRTLGFRSAVIDYEAYCEMCLLFRDSSLPLRDPKLLTYYGNRDLYHMGNGEWGGGGGCVGRRTAEGSDYP